MPPQKLLRIAKSSKNHFVTSSMHILEMPRYRPIWTYQSSTFSDWSIIQEAKVLRSLPPESLICHEQTRNEILFRLEHNMDTSSAFDVARIVCYGGDARVEATNMHGQDTLSLSKQRFMMVALILMAFVVVYIHTTHLSEVGSDQTEMTFTNNNHHQSILLRSIKSMGMTLVNQWDMAKTYVEQDPDLFIIYL
jgi:hypothetical protein